MTLSGLLVLLAATWLMVRGFEKCGVLLAVLGFVLLILGRPVPTVDDVIRKGNRKP